MGCVPLLGWTRHPAAGQNRSFHGFGGLRLNGPHPVRREDHRQARSATASSATRAAGVAASSRTVTGPMIRSIDAIVVAVATAIGDATGAANSAPATSGTTSLPFRASVRQDDRWLAFNPCRCATSFTVTPGTSVYEDVGSLRKTVQILSWVALTAEPSTCPAHFCRSASADRCGAA